MAAESSRRAPKKRITDDEWQSYKLTIGKLYLDEGKDVKEVRDTMKRDFNFDAHEKAYKRKFEEWGMTKNVPKDEGLFMVKKRERRREQGKDTIFWRRRRAEGPLQLVPDDKVDRIADRYSHDLNSLPDSPVPTPNNIEYGTPHQTPSAHPSHAAHHPRSVANGGAVGTTNTSIPISNYVDLNTGAEWPFPQMTMSQAPQPRLPQPTLAEVLGQPQFHHHHQHAHHQHQHLPLPAHLHQQHPPPTSQPHPQQQTQPLMGHGAPTATSVPWGSWNNNSQFF